jgi:hypothetical protein
MDARTAPEPVICAYKDGCRRPVADEGSHAQQIEPTSFADPLSQLSLPGGGAVAYAANSELLQIAT